jgi:dihydrolipoamide dehydrogenase
MYDIIILGGGPAGYTAAERASSKGMSVLLIEKQSLGGVCLNEGCIPLKTILYSAKVLDTVRQASKYAVTANDVSFDFNKIISRKNKIVKKLLAGVKLKLKKDNIVILDGKGFVLNKKNDDFTVVCNDQTFSAKKLLLCTGSKPIIPTIEGLQDIDFLTSREALSAVELPGRLTIVGGGVIGMEFASFFNSLGVKVSIVELLDEIISGADKELCGMLRTEYAKRGVVFHLETKILSVTETEVTVLNKNRERIVIPTDRLLLSVGRKPRTERFGLECLQLKKTKNGGIWVDENMQTSQPGVYACGDVTGYSLLAHTAAREAEAAVNHIAGEKDRMSYKAIPSVIYTNPEIAWVGYTEEQLLKENIPYKILKLPMSYSGRFTAENEGTNGLCKIFVDDRNIIKGVHLLGNPASEMITAATMAIEADLNIDQWKKVVFPHPTVHEIMKDTLYTVHDASIKRTKT